MSAQEIVESISEFVEEIIDEVSYDSDLEILTAFEY